MKSAQNRNSATFLKSSLKASAVLAALPWVLSACSDATGGIPPVTGAGTGAGGAGAVGTPMGGTTGAVATGQCLATPGADGNLLLTASPANNYWFTSDLTVRVTPVAPNTELTFAWTGLTEDFLHHPLNPAAGVDTVALIIWDLNLADFQVKLNNDELKPANANGAIAFYNSVINADGSQTRKDVTTATISDFGVPGTGEIVPREELLARLDPTNLDPATHTYTVMPMTGTTLGEGVLSVQAFQLDANSINTHVEVDTMSTALQSKAVINVNAPVFIPAATNTITVDWSGMTMNALGREWKPRSVDQVMIGRYLLTPEEIEDKFLDLDYNLADNIWRGQVEAGNSLALTALTDANGAAFTGIDGTGTWILALVCGACGNPAPWYLAIVKPCG